MKARYFLLIFILFFIAPSYAPIYALSLVDATGQQFVSPQPAQRIVSLAPHVTELLFAVGAGEQVVGVVSYSNYPPAALKIPEVGGYEKFDREAILALKPDLLIGWLSGNPIDEIDSLRKLGIPLFMTEPRSLEDVASSLLDMGQLTGQVDQANKAAADYMSRLALLQKTYHNRPKLKVFYQVWHQPLMTLNGEHLVSDVLQRCGGKNIFSELPTIAPQISLEEVLLRQPEVILTGLMGKQPAMPDALKFWLPWKDLAAVQKNNLFYLDADLIHRHTPRILDGMEIICKQLQIARSR